MSIDLPGHYEHLRFTKIDIVYRPVGCFRVCVRRGFHCVCLCVLEPLWSWLVLTLVSPWLVSGHTSILARYYDY